MIAPALAFVLALPPATGSSWQSQAVIVWRGSIGFPNVGDASIAVTAWHPFELELGAGGAPPDARFFSGYVRAGASFLVRDTRAEDGTGWTTRIPVRAGVRGYVLDDQAFLSVNAVAGVVATWWFSPPFGIDLEAVAGWVYAPAAGSPGFPDIRLSVGLAF